MKYFQLSILLLASFLSVYAYNTPINYSRSVLLISPNGNECWAGGSTQIIKWSSSDSGFVKYRLILSRNGTSFTDTIAYNIAPAETIYNWILPVLNLSTCLIKIQTLDSVNNIVSEDVSDANFSIDSEQPGMFNLIFPYNSTWAGGLPKFIWQKPADVSPLYYQLFVDGLLKKDSINDTTYTLSPPQLSEGWRTWFIRAFDRIGLWRQSTQTYSVRIDTIPPNSFNLISPNDNIWTTGSDLSFSWQASSDNGSGLLKYQLWIDNGLHRDNISINQTSTNYVGNLPSGNHFWQIKAVDSAGNMQVSNQTRILKTDNTQPEPFNLTSPIDSSWINQHYPRFFWHATQDTNVGLKSYKLCMYNQGFGVNWSRACSSAEWSNRRQHASVVFNNKMWVLGGSYSSSSERNDVWYSSNGINWFRACSSAGWSARYGHSSIVFDNKIWIIGGYDNNYRNDVWYSSDGINWSRACSSAAWSGRRFHTSLVFDNKMWVIGGYGGGYKNDVWYSIDGANWTQATASAGWVARNGHTSVVFDGKMWVIGGYSGTYKNDVWSSNNGINWTQVSVSAGWTARRYHTSAIFDNKIWVLGGYDNSYSYKDIWYSSNGTNWLKATDSAQWSARYGHTSLAFDNKTWVLGGYDGSFRNDVWSLNNYADTIIVNPPDTSVVFANSLIDGKHPWEVLAYDSLGNCRNSNQLWSVYIDSTPPTSFSLLSPADSAIRQIQTPTFIWHKSSDAGIGFRKYELWIDNIKNIDSLGQNDTATAPATLLSEGLHTWFVKASDRINNIRQSSQTYSVFLDWNTPDTFSLINPIDNETTATQLPRFIWHPACDIGSGLKKYQLWINNAINRDSIPATDTTTFPISPLPNNTIHTWFINAIDRTDRVRSSNQTLHFITKDVIAPTVPLLLTPLNNTYLSDSTPRFYWHKSYDLTGIQYYQIQYATNPSFISAVSIDVSDTSYQVPVRLLDTTYYWRVNATDFGANWSGWSTIWQFEIDTRIPLTPTLLEPINGVWRNTSNIIFNWVQVMLDNCKTEKGNDEFEALKSPIKYIVQVDSNRNFSSPIKVDTTSFTQDTFILSEQQYFWRVRVYDLAGNQGIFSNIDSFGVDITAPTIPILTAPENGLFTNTQTVNFKWLGSSDNLSGTKFYTLQYSISSAFINTITLDSISDTTATSLSLGDSMYFWRVRAKDNAGNFSDWSQTRSFRIYTQIPSIPVLITPQNNIVMNNSNVNFVWYRSTSPIIYFYKLQYARNALFTNPDSVIRYDTLLTLTLTDSVFYWRVRSIDSASNISNWSAVWSFEIDTRTPNIPSLISPTNGIWLLNNLTIFNWSQVNSDKERSKKQQAIKQEFSDLTSAVRYILQVDTNRNFINPISDTTGLTYDTLILNQSRYFWRIRAFDLAGNQGTFSGYDSFGIDYTAPTIPNLIAPVNNVTFTDSFVQFYWNRSLDNVSGVVNYRIQIALNLNFTFPIDLTFNDTTLLITLDDTTYFWRVKAIDRANNESNWSVVKTFRVLTTDIQEQNSNELTSLSFNIYPNPSRAIILIKLSLPYLSAVRLQIYDKTGKIIKTLLNESKQKGSYFINWNCRDDADKKVSPGIYFYTLEACGKIIRQKVILLK